MSRIQLLKFIALHYIIVSFLTLPFQGNTHQLLRDVVIYDVLILTAYLLHRSEKAVLAKYKSTVENFAKVGIAFASFHTIFSLFGTFGLFMNPFSVMFLIPYIPTYYLKHFWVVLFGLF